MSSSPRLLRDALPGPPEAAAQWLTRALWPMLIFGACSAFFAIGFVVRSTLQVTAPPSTPAQALPAASVQTDEATAPPIASLLITRPAPSAPRRRHASAVAPAAGGTPQVSQTGRESQTGSSAAPSEPARVEAPSKAPSAAPSPAPSAQPAPSGGRPHSAPKQKSSGSFDSSG